MGKKDKSKNLSWDDFQSLGNPANAPKVEETKKSTVGIPVLIDKVRIYVEKKGRGGKKVTLIKGLTLTNNQMKELTKDLKGKCGVGGKVEEGNIMIQGDQRKRLLAEMKALGYMDVKNAGA